MDLPLPASKLDADTVWILGSGPSLDLCRPTPEEVSGPKNILITVNAPLALYGDQATYQASTDPVSYAAYGPPTGTVREWPCWVVPKSSGKGMSGYGKDVHWRIIDNLHPLHGRSLTSGSTALFLALVLFRQPQLNIKRVVVIGIDLCVLTHIPRTQKFYQYAGCLKSHLVEHGSANQKLLAVPPGFYDKPFGVTFSQNGAYRQQAKRIGEIVRAERSFNVALECRSFCNFAKLRSVGHDFGYRDARQLPPGAENGTFF